MSVLAGVEAEAGSSAGPGRGQPLLGLQWKTQGWMATAQENPSSASHSVPGSFRSNWQAQLASLVSATDIPGSTQIRIGAFPDGSQINQQSEFVRSGAPKTSTPGIPALPNPSAGNSMFEANVPAGKGTGSPVDSGAKTPQSVHTQARLNRQRVELQESGPEAQAAEYRDAHGLSGIPSPDSSGAKPAHASKHEKSESVANHLASAPVSTSIFDGLPSVSMTMPAPIVSPADKTSELEIHAPPPDSSATSYPDASQLSSARTPSVEGRFGVEVLSPMRPQAMARTSLRNRCDQTTHLSCSPRCNLLPTVPMSGVQARRARPLP